MKNISYLFIILGVLLILSCSDDSVTSNESTLQLSLEPTSTSINLGNELQFDIQIDECSEPIFGICMQIEFNNEILSYPNSNSIIAGDFFGENHITFAQESDGIVHLTLTLTQSEELVSGSGILCSIFLETINTGTSSIVIISDTISIYDQDGNLIEIDSIVTNNTEITVL